MLHLWSYKMKKKEKKVNSKREGWSDCPLQQNLKTTAHTITIFMILLCKQGDVWKREQKEDKVQK